MVPPSIQRSSSGPVCHQVKQKTATICFTDSRPPCLGSGCTQPVLRGSGPICLSTSSQLGQNGGEVAGLPVQQNYFDCSRMAQHVLVLGPCGHVQPDPIVPVQLAQSGPRPIWQSGPFLQSGASVIRWTPEHFI